MPKILYILVLTCIALGLQACATDDKQYRINYSEYHLSNQQKHVILPNVYSYQQTTNYTCGPAVVMTLMLHYGKLSASQMNHETEMRIAKEMNTTESGTTVENMAAWLRNNGFNVSYGENVSLDMLINNINRGIPTIIIWNDFNLHSMLVVGYNTAGLSPTGDKDVIFTADPASTGSVERNGVTTDGIDSLSPNQLELNQINARIFFNPSHSAPGMYIVATPR